MKKGTKLYFLAHLLLSARSLILISLFLGTLPLFAEVEGPAAVFYEEALVPPIYMKDGEISIVSDGIDPVADRVVLLKTQGQSTESLVSTVATSTESVCANSSVSEAVFRMPESFRTIQSKEGSANNPSSHVEIRQPQAFGILSTPDSRWEVLGAHELKSVANSRLFALLALCPKQNALPSRNSSMPCESSLLKSMTLRSANDWRSSWRPAKTICRLHKSTHSWLTHEVLTPKRSQSLTLSMSDTLSICSSEMVSLALLSSKKQIWAARTVPSLQKKQLEANPQRLVLPKRKVAV